MNARSIVKFRKLALVLLMCVGFAAQAAEIKVIAGAAFSPALAELGPQFERTTGHRLVIQYGILGKLKKQLDSGETFDLAIVPAGLLDGAAKQGRIADGTRVALVRVGMAVAVRSGAPKPDIGSAESFKRALLNASQIAYPPEGAIGVHLAKVLGMLGIAEEMKSRTRAQKTVEDVAPALATGEADLGFAPSTVFAAAPGIETVGPFPPELQTYVQLTAGVGATSPQPDAARALIQYLASPEAAAVYRTKGFEAIVR